MAKRKRDPTFTLSEKMTLLEIVEKHFSVVEAKKTDAFTIKQKNEEWRKIATEFNSFSGVHPREWIVLKNCWENLKKRAKQEQTLRNQHFLGTGGGPPLHSKDDQITKRVLELIQARVSGFVNVFDTDGTQILACSSTEHVSQTEPQESDETDIDNANIIDWSQYTPSMLKEAKNPILIVSPRTKSPSIPSTVPKCDTEECLQVLELNTPLRARSPHAKPSKTSRRRPMYLNKTEDNTLNFHRVKTLEKANVHAEEEHELKMKILRLQEQKENEQVKQEILKTKQEETKLEIFQIQLKKLKD